MSTIMPNGTVFPYGLQGAQGYESAVAAFNQSYRNTGLKAGFVVKSYAANDPSNKSQLCTEYDVQTIEQFENKGSTSILYKNCLSSQGFGSIADFLEFTLRSQTYNTNQGAPTFSSQDGAIVLIRCLDNCGDKAIVVGNLIHPDRPTTITSTAPQLSGTYNGVNIAINNDGSCALTFNGATDSKGAPTSPGQGPTTFQIPTDGSFQFSHSTITIQANKSGILNITTTRSCKCYCGWRYDCDSFWKYKSHNDRKDDRKMSKEIDLNGNRMIREEASRQQILHLELCDLITGVPVVPSTTIFGDV